VLVLLLLVADLAGLVTLLGSAYDGVAIVVFPLLWGIGLMLATAGSPRGEKSAASRLFTISFLLRVGVAIAIYRFGIVGTLGDEDSGGWYAGWGIAQAWKGDPEFVGVHADFLQALRHGNQGYQYLAGSFLYLINTPSRISLAFVSAFAGALTAILVYRIAIRVSGREAAQKAGMLAAIFPSLVAWSSQTLKEPFVILFECAIVYAVLSLRARWSPRTLLFLVGSLVCLYSMRFYAAYLSAFAAVVVLLWRADEKAEERQVPAPLVAGIVVSAVVLGLFASGLWKTETERLSQFNLGWVESFRTNIGPGAWGGSQSGIALPYDVSTPLGVLAAFPLSLLGFLLSPFPWQVLGGSARLKFAMVDVVLWWWLIPKVVAGLRQAWRVQRPIVGQLMLFILPLTVFYSLIFGNAGLAFRERGQILVLLLVFAAIGLAHKMQRGPRYRNGRLTTAAEAAGVMR
jgi:4-amino-4-deoxy-L-arabinose transferase-like glycosyltransferase